MSARKRSAATFALFVFDATNRKPEVLVVVVQVRIVVVVVQAHVVRVVAIVLCRTPEERVVALAVVTPIVEPVAGRQHRERVIIRAVATTVPPTRRFEFCSHC